jgi:ATP diphosphatase
MPALHRASKVQNRASRAGIYEGGRPLDRAAGVFASLHDPDDDVENLVGQALFHLVDFARQLGIDAEVALQSAINRFEVIVRARESGS